MDCGGCIGSFTAAALENGAAHVRCYEPIEKNISVLKQNLARYGDRKTVIEAALVADGSKTATMFLAAFTGSHSLVDNGRAKTITVPARSFRAELRAFKPQVIKLDVEGAEYALLESLKPGDLKGVSCLFIEFHPNKERERRIEGTRAFLVGEGFKIVKTRIRAFTAVRQARLPAPLALSAEAHSSP
jgi:FkbM family methyltransferase